MNIDAMYPPDNMNFVGGGDFRYVGEVLCGMVRENTGLNPDDRILDVGSGIGRVAIPLTQILSPKGTYDGFDISPEGIKWCQEKVTPQYPNFRFQLADVYNAMYHAAGKNKAEDYIFPYDDRSFDLVILTSVFTHLLGTPMENYLAQISRVLDVGGRAFITYYLRTEESKLGIESGRSSWNFTTYRDGCWIHDPQNPEGAVCYDIARIEGLYEKYGFEIEKQVLSDWHSVKGSGAQDVLAARKVRNVVIPDRRQSGLIGGIKRMMGISK